MAETEQNQIPVVGSKEEEIAIVPSCCDKGVDWRLKLVETKGKKRKRRKRTEEDLNQDDGGFQTDPLVVFGTDIMMMILRNLDAGSVALSLLVSRSWNGVASSDRLWSSKVYVFLLSVFSVYALSL